MLGTGSAIFVTATDTAMGKTMISAALMAALKDNGIRVCGMKPVASGCRKTDAGLVSDDALLIQKFNSVELPYELVNPVALENPSSPDIAARLEQREIDLDHVQSCFEAIARRCDCIVVEGIGGWRTPCTGALGMADIVSRLKCPVIMVVGLRLGCINHALLSAEAVRNDGFVLAGWIANQIEPGYCYLDQTLESLGDMLRCPFLGMVPYTEDGDIHRIAAHLNLDEL